ncbi:hypothetical protein R1flu_008107 [Riccia fluitans]|uniref:Uncharacterized protein n=1 Tax=Riccia fluitans TaxID=41844 RepID=A0ABD1YAS7_9MARC
MAQDLANLQNKYYKLKVNLKDADLAHLIVQSDQTMMAKDPEKEDHEEDEDTTAMGALSKSASKDNNEDIGGTRTHLNPKTKMEEKDNSASQQCPNEQVYGEKHQKSKETNNQSN